MRKIPKHLANPDLLQFGSSLKGAVRARRIQLGLTQRELADRSGLTRTFICMFERDARDVSLSNFERLSAALEMTPSQLMRYVEELSRTIVYLD